MAVLYNTAKRRRIKNTQLWLEIDFILVINITIDCLINQPLRIVEVD